MPDLLAAALAIGVHVLGGGVWIGAMFFSVFVLPPRAERYFQRPADFEDLLFTVVQGARWKVLAGVAAIVASGLALYLTHRAAVGLWPGLIAAKVALLDLVLALIVQVTWVLWPPPRPSSRRSAGASAGSGPS